MGHIQHINMLSKLGKLALYSRLYLQWARNPRDGKKLSARELPHVKFNADVYCDCADPGSNATKPEISTATESPDEYPDLVSSTANPSKNATKSPEAEKCVNQLFKQVSSRTNFLFPVKGSKGVMNYTLE